MDQAKKNNLKRIIAAVCAAAVVILLAAMPLLTRKEDTADGPQASILSGTVAAGCIETQLIGGGTLAEEEAVTVSVPAAVKLTEYLVSNGDTVSAGEPIASVDRVTIMTAIAQVQETLDYLAGEIEAESETETSGAVIAQAGGTVKEIYAGEGGRVQDMMLEHGALAVLSLNGLMAVDLETESDLSAGDAVVLTFSDGTNVDGTVESNLAGTMVVTTEDDGYAPGEAVQITAGDGTVLGTGELYIHSPWNATAYAGVIESVKVSEGEEVAAGETLFQLSDTGHTAAYQQLINQRTAYEELMMELFEMYQTRQITAPCDGIISGVDPDSVQLLSDDGEGYVISFLAGAPNGDDETSYTNYIGQVTAADENGWALALNPVHQEVADYTDLSGVNLDTEAMTETLGYIPDASVPIYERADNAWQQIDAAAVIAGDILLFAQDAGGNLVWIVRVQQAEEVPAEPTQPEVPTEPEDPTEPEVPTEPTAPTESAEPSEPVEPTVPVSPTIPSGGSTTQPSFTYPTAGSADSSFGGTEETEPEFELYGMETSAIAAVTPQDTMTLDITIDELDILALQPGQTAAVTIDALGGETVAAVITDISNTGVNSGGSSKFTVELTLEREGKMLSGMSASAVVTLQTADDVLSIPVAALVEEGTQTLVYTGCDEENGILTDPVAVTVGASDGENAEILDGLSAGTTYYYAYYDTLEISVTPDFGGRFRFGS